MSPVGRGVLSLTKFYRLRELAEELASVSPGMTSSQVQNLLGSGHEALADDLFLYSDGAVVDDPLLQACRARSPARLALLWVALVMADHRLAELVESFLTDSSGRFALTNVNTDRLESEVSVRVGISSSRKVSSNILSYLRDSHLIEPLNYRGTIVGVAATNPTGAYVPDAVRYLMFRVQHLGIPFPDEDDVDVALHFRANHWLNLTEEEFHAAYAAAALPDVTPPSPPASPPGALSLPVATEVEIEASNTETFEVSGQSRRTAIRREQPLVLAYKAWMSNRGSRMVRYKFRPVGVPAHLYCDIYDSTRNNLVEAKADASRPSIRTAIGQLMDYRRFVEGAPSLAVLTERRPHADLEALLGSLEIACVWRDGERFVDNAGGQFV